MSRLVPSEDRSAETAERINMIRTAAFAKIESGQINLYALLELVELYEDLMEEQGILEFADADRMH